MHRHCWESIVTSGRSISGRSVTHTSSDGTTASIERHSVSIASAALSSGAIGEPESGFDATASVSKVKVPDSRRSRLNTTSESVRSSVVGASSSVATTSPLSTQILPEPLGPSIRSRPVFSVKARRRSTSARAKVSRLPESATATSFVERHQSIGTQWRATEDYEKFAATTSRIAATGAATPVHSSSCIAA